MSVYILGLAGGSGSGKTHFAKRLQQQLGEDNCALLYQDNYYFDQSDKFDTEGGAVNFDHPSSLDFSLLARDLSKLRQEHEVQIPLYDFVTHSRRPETLSCRPRKVILVDGILILNSELVRNELNEAIFFDTPEELRFERRLKRDVAERGRTPEGVRRQFELQVRPMHDTFVEPSKCYADVIVKDVDESATALEAFLKRLSKKLSL